MNTKQIAAEKAVELIQDGMIVGLGTGSTAYFAIQKIGQRVQEGLNIQAVASSKASEELARQFGIPLLPFADVEVIDITIDGADEVDPNLSLIKGGGGALLREKILAGNSKRFIVIVDETKIVPALGTFPLPVEIVPFAYELTVRKLQALGAQLKIREANGTHYITDNGNLIADCHFGDITDPETLHQQLNTTPGVVDNGLFVHMTSQVIVGHADGTLEILSN
ncbi:ribose 5-phosphate isomerase A [Paenibacillus selenitireducens]|jgi:ribose 5-phosphate isomerase A|uniref:Ribose-5-phosphate isomerase A n=1 Tax=Paenibacillus selenitireducens TaxID=1324314 RepID=A0A1T2XJX3_9BACL|nr:ribose-5-phosphate isomerase RpiA [Paenibacillus selenitireducens]OPA80122.1 ribose 5-phosphate isomerase A [Paenibacillus selenitireducens]